jgi:hypothetical protein
LLASILWTWRAKTWTAKLDRAAEEVLRQLSKLVQFGGGEMITFADLQASRVMAKLVRPGPNQPDRPKAP